MKKIECLISDEKDEVVNNICDKEGYTRAEFNRRAIEHYLLTRPKVLNFNQWLEEYRKNGGDDRGYAYPIVQEAWEAARKV